MSNKPTGSSHVAMTMAGLSFGGGMVGFLKSQSKPSLIGGSIVAAGFGGAVYLINNGQPREGFAVASGSGMLLFAAMGSRYAKTKQVFPAGVLCILGAVSAAYHFSKFVEWSQ